MKQYVGFVRDHSASMRPITRGAAKDYNSNLLAFQTAARENGVDTILTVVECGVGQVAKVVNVVVNSNVYVVEPIAETAYHASGTGTPLFDSVNQIVSLMRNVPDAFDPQVSFLVMVITDGQENSSSRGSKERMMENIRQLQATDHWTFVFRVPRGNKSTLLGFGVPEGNILEWDQTERGFEVATHSTVAAVDTFYRSRSMGATASSAFYADLHNVTPTMMKHLIDVSKMISSWYVSGPEDGMAIKEFVEKHSFCYVPGTCYYQLTKTETVQPSKKILVEDAATLSVYTGYEARRQLLGLPAYGDVRLVPGNLGNYHVYIQSTSVNRKLVGDTKLLYYVG